MTSAWATEGCGVKLILSGRACSSKEKRLTARDSKSPAHGDGVFSVFVSIIASWNHLHGFSAKRCFCSDGGCCFVETVIGQRTMRELAIRHKDAVRERRP